ncbi:acyl-CoA thioesterase II [Streptomyces sp. NBC_01525]|uniref:acyl-CoA thioesterase n=1 Tax=Streptomyces sp. NBC_01525 TaxID=2903893 RepID=UPI00386F775C
MNDALKDLLDLLDLERIDQDIFRGASRDSLVPRVFGGQVAAQALVAAGRTVAADRPQALGSARAGEAPLQALGSARAGEAPLPHSLHAYFLRPGDPGAPIVYTVDRIRDGRSFSNRRVVAVQHGQPIFHLSASFQVHEEGLEHQETMPKAPDPLSLPTAAETLPHYAGHFADPDVTRRLLRARAAIDLRYVEPPPYATPGEPREPRSQVWFRTNGSLDHLPFATGADVPADDAPPARPLLDICLVTYVSDMTLLDSVLLAHGRGGWAVGDVVGASLDHAMWFHRPLRADDWLLYDQESPTAQGGRGLGRGRIFTADGQLAVSVIQEGVIRAPRG